MDVMVWFSMIGWAALAVLHSLVAAWRSSRGPLSEEWLEMHDKRRMSEHEMIVAMLEAASQRAETIGKEVDAWLDAQDEAIEAKTAAEAEGERVEGLTKELDARVASFIEALESLPCPKCRQ